MKIPLESGQSKALARPPRIALAVATAGGVGLAPIAPGTWGSAVGVAAFVALSALPGWLWLPTLCAVVALGVWASDLAEDWFDHKDDGRIVIDEVAGQMIALCPLLFFRSGAIGPSLVTGFVAFRVFDIWKPGPVRWAERNFRGGVGVMADDIIAGLLAALVVVAMSRALSLPVEAL